MHCIFSFCYFLLFKKWKRTRKKLFFFFNLGGGGATTAETCGQGQLQLNQHDGCIFLFTAIKTIRNNFKFLFLVRSYGTEDRETQFPISPQNQVYDYILFRGSDIKDIRVVNNVPAMPNDPAIMQMQLPPTHMGQQPFQTSQFVPGPMGHMGTQMGPFGGPYTAMPNLGGLTASGLAPGSMAPGGGIMPPKTKQASELNIAIPAPTTTAELKDQGTKQNYDPK